MVYKQLSPISIALALAAFVGMSACQKEPTMDWIILHCKTDKDNLPSGVTLAYFSQKGQRGPFKATRINTVRTGKEITFKCELSAPKGAQIQVMKRTWTAKKKLDSFEFKLDLTSQSAKRSFWSQGVSYPISVKFPHKKEPISDTLTFKVSLSKKMARKLKRSFEIYKDNKRSPFQKQAGKDIHVGVRFSTHPGSEVQIGAQKTLIAASGKGASAFDVGAALWKEPLQSAATVKTTLKATVTPPGGGKSFTKFDRSFYLPIKRIVKAILAGKIKLPPLSGKRYPRGETTMVIWSGWGHESHGILQSNYRRKKKAPFAALTHFVKVKQKRGQVKRCGPFRTTKNFVKSYGKKRYYKVLHLDADITIFDRNGKRLAQRFFRNRTCPSVITNRKKPVSSLRFGRDKRWKRWILQKTR